MRSLFDYASFMGVERASRFILLLQKRPKYIKALLILRKRPFVGITEMKRMLRMSSTAMHKMIAYLTGARGAPKMVTIEALGSRGKYLLLTNEGKEFADDIVTTIQYYAADVASVDVVGLYGVSLDAIADRIGATNPKRVVVIDWGKLIANVIKEYPSFSLAISGNDIDAVPVMISGRKYYAYELLSREPRHRRTALW